MYNIYIYYRFEYCGAFLAFLNPYFLRSFILASLVNKPYPLKIGRHLLSFLQITSTITFIRMKYFCLQRQIHREEGNHGGQSTL